MYFLAGDLGGTKTLLSVFELNDKNQVHILFEKRYISKNYLQFDDLLNDFFNQEKVKSYNIHTACLVVAGAVFSKSQQKIAKITNLPWQLNQSLLAEKFNLKKLKILNDFQGIGFGIPALVDKDTICLQKGQRQKNACCVIIGAGTGLGEAVLIQNTQPPQVIPSEGGHTGFAPETAQQRDLLAYLQIKYPRVTYEHLLSGRGIYNIYQFLCDSQTIKSQNIIDKFPQQDPAVTISQHALAQTDALCNETLALFCQIYASQAANLALTCLAYGGVYIAGGIAVKNLSYFQSPNFMQAFLAKQPMTHLLEKMPVHVISNENVGLLGAIEQAKYQANNNSSL